MISRRLLLSRVYLAPASIIFTSPDIVFAKLVTTSLLIIINYNNCYCDSSCNVHAMYNENYCNTIILNP